MEAQHPQIIPFGAAAIAAAAAAIRAGGIVAVSTETVYGLAADARDGAAVARIYAAKGRPSFNPLIVHVADLAAAEAIGRLSDADRALAARTCPGPQTPVVPPLETARTAPTVPPGLSTVTPRVPAHPPMPALHLPTRRSRAAASPHPRKHQRPSL